MNPLRKNFYVLRYLGSRMVLQRAKIAWNRVSGRTRRVFAPRSWEALHLNRLVTPGCPSDPRDYVRFKRERAPGFLFPLGRPPELPPSLRHATGTRQPTLAERLRLLGENRCVYFFYQPAPTAVSWYVDPFFGKRSDPTKGWWELPDYAPQQGDMRVMWEPSRASWGQDLMRARAHGLAVPAAELFWRWVDSWMAACPPYLGFQWKCGQESSVRLIGLALAFWSLADDPCTTPARWVQFARLAWATGYRVAHHIDYAISQKNNHALSEACGLLLVSHLFPEFRDAARWHALGRRVLADELRRQTYADGSYLQHSMNYHRVMLHVSLLGLRLAELAGRPFERDLYDCLARGGEFLFQMMEPQTGHLPQYGNNDGANVLALSECDFSDYRPVIQAVHYLTRRQRVLPSGPWDEDLLWLFGPEALAGPEPSPRPPDSSAFEAGGYYTLRRGDSWVMLRCHTYRDRPGHCDPLHLDLWWRGQNVVQDCGTYLYYVPERPDLEYYFQSIAAHNTIEIGGRDPLERVSRFLWFPWPRAKARRFLPSGQPALGFEGEHYGYDRPPWRVVHRRLVLGLSGDVWVVVDDLLGEGPHRAVLRWHLLDAPWDFDEQVGACTLKTPAGEFTVAVAGHPTAPQTVQVIRGHDQAGEVQGFASPYYGERRPIPVFEARVAGELPVRLATVLGPAPLDPPRFLRQAREGHLWHVRADGKDQTIVLAPPARAAPRTLLDVRLGVDFRATE